MTDRLTYRQINILAENERERRGEEAEWVYVVCVFV